MSSGGVEPVLLEGAGLFSGIHARVWLSRSSGPIRVALGPNEAAIEALVPTVTGRTSALEGRGVRVTCVEHLFSAVAAFGIGAELRIETDAEELPLLDGGAIAWSRALRALGFGIDRTAPRWRIGRNETLRVGRSEYRFEVRQSTSCSVEFETDDARLITAAAWNGELDDFERRVAPARTFVDERELLSMLAQGYRATVDPESVIVLGATIHAAGRPFEADEPARHKLLDLIGDLALHGGPPLGHLTARRPGHAATHAALAQAVASGIITASP